MTRAPCSTISAAAGLGPLEVLDDPLGVELDGRQRVLDLVGDALGDFLPGGDLLGLDELGQVVEDDDQPGELPAGRLSGVRVRARVVCWPFEEERDLLVGQPVAGPHRRLDGREEVAVARVAEDLGRRAGRRRSPRAGRACPGRPG